MDITIGKEGRRTMQVDSTNTASALDSGLADVFATPMLVAIMESAAVEALEGCLDAGQGSVGTHISVSHDAATPIGMTVTATARITAVDRRRVEFEVSAADDAGPVGKGTHTRFIIDNEQFMKKIADKAAGK